jgi:oligosaccharide amylase
MAVYQPNAALGNARVLVTLGASGEIMTFFYPHVDFAQNVHQGMPAVYLGDPGHGVLTWTYEDAWERRQAYEPRRNVLVTALRHPATGLELTITDFVLLDRDALVRRFELHNAGDGERAGAVMQYLHLRLGEIAGRNSARRLDDHAAIVQYFRDTCFAMGGDPPDATQIGKAGGGNGAKGAMSHGWLNNQREELGDVDSVRAWRFRLAPGESWTRVFVVAAASREPDALALLADCRAEGFEALHAATVHGWDAWLAQAKPVALDAEFAEPYYRALLTTRLLYDAEYGAFLAAPEFDPDFERCGGYGFVWPRDAAEVVLALEEAGLPAMVEGFFAWARDAQHAEGYWDQRYWASGAVGPGWCSFLDSIQIDQTGSMVHALGVHAARLVEEADRADFRARYWSVVERAASYLERALGANGLHTQAFDLWEKFRGSFTYSNASIHAALLTAAEWGEEHGEIERAQVWRDAAVRIKAELLAQCWNGAYFARGLTTDGQVDWGIDSAMLGVFDPFPLLSLDVPEERAMVESAARTVVDRLTTYLPPGPAIIRHKGDDYVDGSAGGVNTLWLARVLLRLAVWYRDVDAAASAAYRAQAETYLRTVLGRATPGTGLLSELIGSHTTPRWAVPHGWAMASYVQCALLLQELG